jgi:hypothetical protein
MAANLTDTNQSSTMMESQGSSRMTIVLALLTIVGIAVYLLNLAVLHFLRTDVNPMQAGCGAFKRGPRPKRDEGSSSDPATQLARLKAIGLGGGWA